ncbi:relaxase domain-containing protein [Corynebacterium uropygiale]|uniref:Relaxase domain-containing protein n=1 Tax=Corynebacterium uropygiale TaxID=1775911 RepID=A0A9X1QUH6_9CORY|nr:relaxase domain-containing protein [Corynebacterium uropygiale]
MLTIAKMHGESVAYYESTVDEGQEPNLGPDGYYSEDGRRPAEAWIVARSDEQAAAVSEFLGVKNGARVDGKHVRDWFNQALAPNGTKLGRAPKSSGVPGFDLTFCAPKSVSLVWGLTDDAAVRALVDGAHQRAVSAALAYLSEHAGYTRRADDVDRELMIIDRVEAISGVKYEHRTSRAGDPHVHSHVLLSNKQLCRDGKWRTLDGVSLYHEARAAGTIYQAVLREELSRELGVEWAETVNGCAEISGLDDRKTIEAFSTRAREIDQWRDDNGLADVAMFKRMGQKKTRQKKDVDTPLEELVSGWKSSAAGVGARDFIAGLSPRAVEGGPVEVPTAGEIIAAVTAERSTFTRADVVEKVAEMLPVGVAKPGDVRGVVERITDEVFASLLAWTVTPDKDRSRDKTAREGTQRFTSEDVVSEVNRGIDLATEVVAAGVSADTIQPVEGRLSRDQAEAMRAVVTSRYRASVVIAPAGAGKTSSLKAARGAWEKAGKTVVGLAPTGKAADVMVGENVADSSSTLARVLRRVDGQDAADAAATLGWDRGHVVVVDEAGMVATPDIVRVLEVASAADARVVLVGDPYQYGAVKARGGMLATLAYELPDAVELTEVFRQKDAAEREASKRLRTGEVPDVERAATFYADRGRLHAGSVTAMLDDALAGWREDIEKGKQSLLVASSNDYVDALNVAAQKVMAARGALDLSEAVQLTPGQFAHVGDTILTRRNDYELTTSAGDVVRNGQRWSVVDIGADGSVMVRRLDETDATVTLSPDYLRSYTQLGYASTGHSAQGATVDVARVVAGVGQMDRAGVYVPMTRGREGNYLYMAEAMPGDTDTGHGQTTPAPRRESATYARDLLIQAATRSTADQTPHYVHRQARRDWALVSLSGGVMPDEDPFRGTRMAEVADERAQARIERLSDFHTVSHEDVAGGGSVSQPKKTAKDHANPYQEKLDRARERVAELERRKTDVSEQIKQLDEQYRQAVDGVRDASVKINGYKRMIREEEYRRDNRGFFAKAFKPNEGLAQIETWTEKLAQAEQAYDNREAYRAELEERINQLRQEQRNINAEYDKADGIMHAIKALHFTYRIIGGQSFAERMKAQRARSSRYREQNNATAWDMTDTYGHGDGMTL